MLDVMTPDIISSGAGETTLYTGCGIVAVHSVSLVTFYLLSRNMPMRAVRSTKRASL